MTPEEHPDELAVREQLARAVDGVQEVDLAPAALAGARARRRRRAAVGVGGGVAAVALVTALAINGLGGGSAVPVDPAASTSTAEEARPAREAREANQRLLDAIGGSGIAMDYQPLASPYEAMEAPLIVVGDVRSVRLEGGDAGPEVRMVVDVTRHLAGAEEPAMVEASFSVGGRFGLSQGDLDAVRGPVLLVVGNLEPDASGVPRAYPYVDGAWFDVPTGIDGPYVDYADLEGYWPPSEDVEGLAEALSSLPPPGSDLPDPQDPQAFARAEEIAVAMEQETRVDAAACQARLLGTEADQVAWAWVRCTGEAPAAEPGEASGLSVPVRQDADGLHVPGDGSRYEADVLALFPADLADRVLGHDGLLLPEVVSPEELGLARTMARVAGEAELDPAALRLSSSGVGLALGPDVVATRSPLALQDPASWAVDHPDGHFRAAVGPFSALELLARHRESHGADTLRIGAGEHPRCAARPAPQPSATDGLRHVWIQPSAGSLSSCLEWFAVDLYLDEGGEIRVVGLDVWEP